ncbi:MAG: nicotinamidase [candidate division FCPU426 bacterium]
MSACLQPSDALIVVDVQRDFLPGGALAVSHGDQIIPVVNRLLTRFSCKVFTRDWHPADHLSFSAQPAFTDKSWPPHCVQNTPGAEFHPDVRADLADRIVSKGADPKQEAYSGFQGTDLASWLQARMVKRVFVAGLATDYCVKATALDAKAAGFSVFVVTDAVRGVDQPAGSAAAALDDLEQAGVRLTTSQEMLKT